MVLDILHCACCAGMRGLKCFKCTDSNIPQFLNERNISVIFKGNRDFCFRC
jgi:hypothetical protein